MVSVESRGGPGGKGANQAVAAALLGADVRMVGKLGGDVFAGRLRDELAARGVDVDSVTFDAGESGLAMIVVDREGENEIVVAAGANGRLAPGDVELGEHDAVLCQLEIPPLAALAAARRCDGLFCLNAAPARAVPAELVERADLLVANRHELAALETAPRGLTALTLGAEGAVLLEGGDEVARARPPRVVAVDGTAAGDAFCACLVVSLLEGRDREEALGRACTAGAIAASRPGAQPSLPTAAEVDALVAA